MKKLLVSGVLIFAAAGLTAQDAQYVKNQTKAANKGEVKELQNREQLQNRAAQGDPAGTGEGDQTRLQTQDRTKTMIHKQDGSGSAVKNRVKTSTKTSVKSANKYNRRSGK